MAKKQMNFYKRYTDAAKAVRGAKRAKTLLWAAPLVVIVCGCMGVWGVLMVHTRLLNTRSNAILEWCLDPAQLTPYNQYLNDKAQGDTYRGLANYADGINTLTASYPAVTSSLMGRIEAAGGASIAIEFTSYDAATGELSFDAVSSEVIDIPTYIRSLEECGVFNTVSYTGYNAAGSTNSSVTAGSGYTINLRCVLAAPEEVAP